MDRTATPALFLCSVVGLTMFALAALAGVEPANAAGGELLGQDVGDRVWRDLNGNGIQDGGEPGVAGVTVTLFTESGVEVGQTVTNGDGLYSFPVANDTYFLQFTLPAGDTFSPRDAGGDDALDSDAAEDGRTSLFTVSTFDDTQDAGLLPRPPAAAAGDDFQVNTYTTGVQNRSSLGMAGDGDFVLVYRSQDAANSIGVRGQRYASDGSALGSEFQVNTYTTGTQILADVSVASSGDFVVVWHSEGSSDSDTDGSSVQGQRFASDGSALGGEFQVNDYTTGDQSSPVVSMDDSGAFVVVWESEYGDGDGYGIQARRFASNGGALGESFQVNEVTGASQVLASVSSDDTHGFVITWNSYEYIAFRGPEVAGFTDNSPPSVQGRRFANDGSPVGSQFQVNTYTTGAQANSSVHLFGNGDFVVTYQSVGSAQGDLDESVQMQRFGSDGTPVGSELQVNTYTTSNQSYPSVSRSATGDFVVVWQSRGSADGNDPVSDSIQGQRFSADGLAIEGQFTVNSFIPYGQMDPDVAMDPRGDFAVSWTHDYPSPTDGSATSVRARRFRVTGDLGGRVFDDGDRDGVQDPGEPGVAGVSVDLVDSGGATVASTVTDNDGEYLFPKVDQGEYTLAIPQVPGTYTGFTAQDIGSDDTVDSDFDGAGETESLTVGPGTTALDQDAGLLANQLGDRVWLDTNRNGRQDGGEMGFGGVTVELFTLGGVSQGSAVTAADGTYAFEAVSPGDYFLTFSEPKGFCFTALAVGDDAGDSDVNPETLTTGTIGVGANQDDLTLDAGLVPDASIGDRVWLDNGNGIQDGGEVGIPGITVSLFDDQDTELDSTVTDGEGLYGFAPGPGSYYLEFVIPTEWAFAPRDQGVDDGADSDVNAASGTTSVFSLAPGAVDGSRDAGLEPAVIGNRVWIDSNGDGRQQPGEVGLPNVTVRLLNAGTSEVASTTTDAAGLYGFSGVASGDYIVEVILPPGGVFSSQDVGGDDLIDSDVDPTSGRTGVFSYSAGSASRSHDAGVQFQPLFENGFESGDTSQWSNVFP